MSNIDNQNTDTLPKIPYREICRLNIVIAKHCTRINRSEMIDIIISDVRGQHPSGVILGIIDGMVGANFLLSHSNPRGATYVRASDTSDVMARFSEHHVAAWDLIDYSWTHAPTKGCIFPERLPDILKSDTTLLNAALDHLADCGLSKHQHSPSRPYPFSFDRMDLSASSQSALTSPDLLLQTKQAQIIMNNTNNFTGDNQANNLAIGNDGSSINQTASQNTSNLSGDLEALVSEMRKLSVPEDDITELKEALEADSEHNESTSIGERVGGWIGKMAQKAAMGTWKAATEQAPALITGAIKAYYGIP